MDYIVNTTYSVSVSLEALEKHLSCQFRDTLCKSLHVDSLAHAHVQPDCSVNEITFYTMETK